MSVKIDRHHDFTDVHSQFLETSAQGRSYSALAELFNRKFNTDVTHKTIRRLCRILGFTNGKPNRIPYSDEQIGFLRQYAPDTGYSALAEMFNERFGTDTTALRIGELCRRKGFSNGLDSRFKGSHTVNLGRKRADALPDGTEVTTSEGYVMLKHGGAWRYKHIILWEQVHGRSVPEGHFIVFGDGNKQNIGIENLFCITSVQNGIRTKNKLQGATPELAAAGVALAKLYSQIGERTKVQKSHNQRRSKDVHRNDVLSASEC
jgi:hypothetical protein